MKWDFQYVCTGTYWHVQAPIDKGTKGVQNVEKEQEDEEEEKEWGFEQFFAKVLGGGKKVK